MSDAERYGPSYDSEADWPDCTHSERAVPQPATASEPGEELSRLRQALANAAAEINCAGPVVERIRTLKREHAAQIAELKARAPLAVSPEVRERAAVAVWKAMWSTLRYRQRPAALPHLTGESAWGDMHPANVAGKQQCRAAVDAVLAVLQTESAPPPNWHLHYSANANPGVCAECGVAIPELTIRAQGVPLAVSPNRPALLEHLTALLRGLPTPYSEDEPTVRVHARVLEQIIEQLEVA